MTRKPTAREAALLRELYNVKLNYSNSWEKALKFEKEIKRLDQELGIALAQRDAAEESLRRADDKIDGLVKENARLHVEVLKKERERRQRLHQNDLGARPHVV
jgi:predicted  nucleic acid-binding Zn-ribbon protein